MAEHPLARPPRPLAASPDHDDPTTRAGGDVPADPAAKAVTRGCMTIWLIIGAFAGITSLIYWFFIAT